MSLRSRTFRWVVRFCAEEIVDAIYRGALTRPPESAGREQYVSALSRTRDLGAVFKDVLSSQEFHKIRLTALAPELVRRTFQGLLGRDPEPTALDSYAKRFAVNHDLGAVVVDIVQSEEFRKRSLAALVPELVRAIFRGLLGRDPEPTALDSYAKRFAVNHDLGAVVADIVQSEEFRKRSLAALAPELVRSTFQGLLEREPESEALVFYTKAVEGDGDLSGILTQIVRSQEYRKRSTGVFAQELVRAMFEGLFDRTPEPQALAHYGKKLAEIGEIAPVLAEIVRSEEFAKKYLPKTSARTHKSIALNQRATSAFSAQDLQVPKLVFLHHPKSGGTTLHHILLKAFDKNEVCPERFNGLRRYAAGELARYRFFSGHFDLPSVMLIPGRKKIVTMIREPMTRLISLYYFQRAHKQEIIEKNKLDLARLANAYRMKEFFLAPEVRQHPAINNSLTRILVDTVDGDRWEQDARLATNDSHQYAQLALRELISLDAFGLMERYADSVELICESVGLPAPSEIEQRQVLDVIMREEPGLRKIDKEPVTDEVRGLIAGLVQTDQKIYAHAQLLFEQRVSTLRRRKSALRAQSYGHEAAAPSARHKEVAEGNTGGYRRGS
jgi:hypothetical protein